MPRGTWRSPTWSKSRKRAASMARSVTCRAVPSSPLLAAVSSSSQRLRPGPSRVTQQTTQCPPPSSRRQPRGSASVLLLGRAACGRMTRPEHWVVCRGATELLSLLPRSCPSPLVPRAPLAPFAPSPPSCLGVPWQVMNKRSAAGARSSDTNDRTEPLVGWLVLGSWGITTRGRGLGIRER